MANASRPERDLNPYAPPAPTDERPSSPVEEDPRAARGNRGVRLAARVIDNAMLAVALAPTMFLGSRNRPAAWEYYAALLGLLAALMLVLYQWVLVANEGRTLAKRWLGIKVVTTEGEPPGFVRGVLLREWPRTAAWAVSFQVLAPRGGGLGTLALLVWAADGLLIFGARERCLHDRLAGTRVVRTTVR